MKGYITKNRRLPGGNKWSVGGELSVEAGGKLNIAPGAEVSGIPGSSVAAATTTANGTVKKAAKVAEAAGANPTAAEFKALLDALKAAGIMADA